MTLEEFVRRAEQSAPYEPCVGSGYCCTKSPCHVAYATIPHVKAPCPALRQHPSEAYHVCGLYEDATGEKKAEIAHALHIGAGCCSALSSAHSDTVHALRGEADATGVALPRINWATDIFNMRG